MGLKTVEGSYMTNLIQAAQVFKIHNTLPYWKYMEESSCMNPRAGGPSSRGSSQLASRTHGLTTEHCHVPAVQLGTSKTAPLLTLFSPTSFYLKVLKDCSLASVLLNETEIYTNITTLLLPAQPLESMLSRTLLEK